MWGKPPVEGGKSCYNIGMMKSVGSIDCFVLGDGDQMVRLTVNEDFHALDPIDRVRFLVAISQVAFTAASEIGSDHPEDLDEIMEMMQSIELEPVKPQLN
jgi:hypothetical protein